MRGDDFLAFNQYLILNKTYSKHKLAQWGPDNGDVGTQDGALNRNQLWTLEPHPHKPGSYFIINEMYPQHRLANNNHELIVNNGPHHEYQLFKFVSDDEGFYSIRSVSHLEDWLTIQPGEQSLSSFSRQRAGSQNSAKCSQTISFRPKDRGILDTQKWRLIPRLRATLFIRNLFQCDNRSGKAPVSKEITITTGLHRPNFTSKCSSTCPTLPRSCSSYPSTSCRSHASSCLHFPNIKSYKRSVTAAVELAADVLDLNLRYQVELEQRLTESFSERGAETWCRRERVMFTVPPGRNVRVVQRGMELEGLFRCDSCTLSTRVKVLESRTDYFCDLSDSD